MRRFLITIKKASYLFINIYVIVSSLVNRRDHNRVVIGSWDGGRYADNTRYLYEYLRDYTKYSVTWVTKDYEIYDRLKRQGDNVVMMGTREAYKAHIKSYYHIVCTDYADISGEYSWGAYKINLWHGCPMKLVSKLANYTAYNKKSFIREMKIFKTIRNTSVFYPGGWNKCFFLSPGIQGDKLLLEDMQIAENRIIRANYPRNIVEHRLPEENEIIEMIQRHKKSVLFLPTFRANMNDIEMDPVTDKSFRDYLSKNDILWIDKKHFSTVDSSNIEDSQNDNIIHLKSTFDVNSIFENIDMLITDYSSVYFDALYFGKRIILYMPDYEYYKEKDRGFLTDPMELKACLKAFDIKELKKCISDYMLPITSREELEIRLLKEKFWSYSNEGIKEIWGKIVNRADMYNNTPKA